MRNAKFLLGLCAVALCCAAWGTARAADNAVTGAAAQTVAARSAVRQVALTGFTRARTELILVSEEAGRVLELRADVGDPIGRDGAFARLDPVFIKLDIAANRADQARLESIVQYYSRETDRYSSLVGSDTASQASLDERVMSLETNRQQLTALKVEEKRLLERLDRFTIRAPEGWLLMRRDVEVGEWVGGGQQLGVVGRFDELLVPFAVTPEEFAALRKIKDLHLRLSDYGGKTVPARIERVAPGFDAETRKINLDLMVRSGLEEMRGGVRCELLLELREAGGAVMVPRSALVRAYEDYFLVRPDGARVRVLFLGEGEGEDGKGLVRVASPDVKPDDRFLLTPDQG